MRFKLVRTGKSYSEGESSVPTAETEVIVDNREQSIPPIIWEKGNVAQIRALLWLREAELAVAKHDMTGKDHVDCYLQSHIYDLEMKIDDLHRWLAEAEGNIPNE